MPANYFAEHSGYCGEHPIEVCFTMFISLEKRIVCVLSLAICLSMAIAPKVLLAQIVPHIQWIQTYGGLRPDEGYGIVQTGDSGFIIAGYTGDTIEPGLPDYHGGFE